MINSKILALFEEHNINKAQGIAYLYCLYDGDKNIEWIPVETRSLIKLLGLVTIDKNIPVFAYPLWEDGKVGSPKTLHINDNDIIHFVTKTYLPMWPLNTVAVIGYNVNGNTQDCIKRMGVFIKNFNITFNTTFNKIEIFNAIKEATKSYLAHKKIESYSLCKKNNNFIGDNNGSTLEQFVYKYLNGENTDIDKIAMFTQEM